MVVIPNAQVAGQGVEAVAQGSAMAAQAAIVAVGEGARQAALDVRGVVTPNAVDAQAAIVAVRGAVAQLVAEAAIHLAVAEQRLNP